MNNQQHYERARLLVDTKRPKDAEQELLKHLALNPNDASGYSLMATVFEMQRKHEAAIEYAKKAIALRPENAWFHYVLADVFYSRGLMSDCRRTIDEALRLDPTRPRFWGLKANVESAAGNWKETVAAAEQGLSHDPEYVHCKNLRALALARLGKKEAAKSSLGESLERDPDNALTFAYQGWTHIHMHEGEQALAAFSEALRIDPTSEWARQGMMAALRDTHWFFRASNRMAHWAWRLGLLFGFVGSMLVTIFAFAQTENHILAWFLAIPMAFVMVTMFFLCMLSNVQFRANDRWLPGLMMFDKRGKYLLTEQERKRGMISAIGVVLGISIGVIGGFIDHKKYDNAPVPAAAPTQTDASDPVITIVIFVLTLSLIPLAFYIRMRKAKVEEERRHWFINGVDSFIVIAPIAVLGLFMTLAPDWIALPFALFGAAFGFFMWKRHKSNGRIRTLHDAVSAVVLRYWKI